MLGNRQESIRVSNLAFVRALSWREFSSKYRDTLFGASWALLNPILLLVIYGVVFSQVFAASWQKPDGSELNYALAIFSGFIFFNAFAEALNGSTYVISRHANLVKRTQFTLEVLPVSFWINTFYTFLISWVPFMVMYLIFEGLPPLTMLLVIPLSLPIFSICLSLVYLLSSIAVFFPDVKQLNSILTTAILFTSPIFYDSDRLTNGLAKWLSELSPFAILIAFSKRIIFYGSLDGYLKIVILQVVTIPVLWATRKVYLVLSRGFSDVI